jgi:hypothetical protein
MGSPTGCRSGADSPETVFYFIAQNNNFLNFQIPTGGIKIEKAAACRAIPNPLRADR